MHRGRVDVRALGVGLQTLVSRWRPRLSRICSVDYRYRIPVVGTKKGQVLLMEGRVPPPCLLNHWQIGCHLPCGVASKHLRGGGKQIPQALAHCLMLAQPPVWPRVSLTPCPAPLRGAMVCGHSHGHVSRVSCKATAEVLGIC